MSQQTGVLDITLKAAVNLSAKQYYLVKLHSTEGEVTLCAATTDIILGVLQNKPTTGQAAVVRVLGTTKVKNGATSVAINAMVTSSLAGKAITAATDKNWVVGIMMETAAADDIAEMMLSRFKASI